MMVHCAFSSAVLPLQLCIMCLHGLHDICGLQTNIDFEDEADMVEKMRIGVALQPIATALFANSPFRDGKPTGAYFL